MLRVSRPLSQDPYVKEMEKLTRRRYIYPAALRKRMSDVWNEDVTRWWLPNEEGYPPILRSIREFIDYRTRVPQDTASEDLRDMKGLFSAMSMEDSDTKDKESKSSGTTGSDLVLDFGQEEFLRWESSPDMKWD